MEVKHAREVSYRYGIHIWFRGLYLTIMPLLSSICRSMTWLARGDWCKNILEMVRRRVSEGRWFGGQHSCVEELFMVIKLDSSF
jgi:IS5 family transposase